MTTGEQARRPSWTLTTATTQYDLSTAPDGGGLVLDHWGGPATRDQWSAPTSYQFQTVTDLEPLDYSSLGTRQVGGAELIVETDDGRVGLRLSLTGTPEFSDDGRITQLVATLTDSSLPVVVVTTTETCRDHDVVRRWATIRNDSDIETVRLTRVFSAAWPVPTGRGVTINYLAGAWSREFMPNSVTLPAGEFSIGSRQGVTSHSYAPAVVLSAAGAERSPGAYGIALAWSGSWRMLADVPAVTDHARVAGGVDDESSVITLDPGESFTTPAMLGTFSAAGPVGVARNWHHYQRSELARSLGPAHRPIVYNSWYATGFDVTLDHQIRLADAAAEIGAEAFVLDDGWFRNRNTGQAGLGDWTPDPAKFPAGLDPLISAVTDRGMRFGLWVEPEAVSPDSDLFRTHPEWVYRAGDRPLVTVRNQYVLDLGRSDVQEWLAGILRGVLADHRISYLKWDMNRPISDGGRPGDRHGREWSVQHTRAYHRLMRMLRTEFPHVTVEACSAGGGRIDNAVLGLCDVVWTSDETGPRDRLAIQHGYLSAYPAYAMSSWATDQPDRIDRDPVSFEFRFLVGMAGVLGVGSDLLDWDMSRRHRAAELITLYRSIRTVIHAGTVARHGEPVDAWYAVEYATQDTVVILVYARPWRPNHVVIRPQLIKPETTYRIRGRAGVITGAAATEQGVNIYFELAADADVVIMDTDERDTAWSATRGRCGEQPVAFDLQPDVLPHRMLRCRVGAYDGSPRPHAA